MKKKIFYFLILVFLIPVVVYAGGGNDDKVIKDQVKCVYKVIGYDLTVKKEFNLGTYSMILTNFEDGKYEIEDENTKNSKLDSKYYPKYLFDGTTFYEQYTKAGKQCPPMFSYDAPGDMFVYGYFYTQKGHKNADIHEESEREINGTKYVRNSKDEEWKTPSAPKPEEKDETFNCTYEFATDFGVLTDNQLILDVSITRKNFKSQNLINYILEISYHGTKDSIKHPSLGSCKNGTDGKETCEWNTLFELPSTTAIANNEYYLQTDEKTLNDINTSMKGKKCIDKTKIYSYMNTAGINNHRTFVITTDKSKADASDETVYDGDSSDVITLNNLKDSIDTFNSKISGYPTDCSKGTEKEKMECRKKQDEIYKDAKRIVLLCKKTFGDLSADEDTVSACNTLIDTSIVNYSEAGYFGDKIILAATDTDCENTLGALGPWLKTIYDIVKYAVPIVIVVLGIKDFITGTISGNDDALKKAGSTFVKRLLWGAVFIALPVLITMILTFAFGGDFADLCIF